ncbi:hypothetical protein [Sphingomonas oligoaromativorans]|uniref:hypothetical protein n=1 Tax=Sphingomonas oligoaromativorans TaxID=575322 RepID=UPI001422F662|nr:hypothetical protein [Sphingomonas oligoaromativorans]NIJ34435.1 hypothetical protein [Sphingomonas oligoaromativorans]
MTDSRASAVETIARDPLWLPHRYDPGYDAIHYLRLDRAQHDALTFLIDSELPAGLDKLVLERALSVGAAASGAAPLHFIFHSAYCCSTLLARAFNQPGIAMGLKEPTIFNDIVGWRRRGAGPQRVAAVLSDVMTLLAQPFATGEAVIAKPSNVLNGLAMPILAMRPETHALLLHAPLPVYLASIAKKGMWGALWVREHFRGALKDGIVQLGFQADDYLGQTDLQIAAAGWLAQHAVFEAVVKRFGPGRVRTLDSDTLLARKGEALAALSRLFGLAMTREQTDAIADGPIFARHSKFATPFGAGQREREHEALPASQREEIEKVTVWAEAVAAHAGIPLQLGAPLLD